jgi:hypothetical protein
MLSAFRRFWVRRPSAVRRVDLSRPPGRGRNAYRPAVEALEPRLTPTLTFAPQQTFTVGTAPQGIVMADVNGDGRPDLIVANFNDNTVSVLLNTTPAGATTPSFAAQKTFAVGNGPFAVAAADVNGDGRPDLVVANFTDSTVSVLLNTTVPGSATAAFAPQQTFAVGAADAVAAADVNGDGRPDLVVAGGSTVSVLLNTTVAGSATAAFAPQQTFAVGPSPLSVAAADLNGDGRPDLAVANEGNKTVSVLLNTTTAGATTAAFAPQQTFAVGTLPDGVAAVDLNGDSRPDLAVANLSDNTVSVLLNTTVAGSGTAAFATQQTFAVGTNPVTVVAADLDGDGRPDLAVTNRGGNSVSVLLNTTAVGASAPSFATQQTFAVGAVPIGVAAADVNGDGRPDLAVANSNTLNGLVSVLLDTTAPFASPTPVVVGAFGSTGVWEFNRTTGAFVQIGTGTASSLAADPQGDVAGAFGNAGVWLYKPSTGFRQIGTGNASLLAMDSYGDVAGSFPGAGIWLFRPSTGFHQIGTGNASVLAMDALGDVVGTFPGHGVWLFRPAVGFQQIGSGDASILTINALGDVIGTFPKAGVWEFRPAVGFQQINTADATALAADPIGNVVASFAGVGVAQFQPTVGWHKILPGVAAVLGMDALDDVFGEFPGAGVWQAGEFRFVTRLLAADASVLVVA